MKKLVTMRNLKPLCFAFILSAISYVAGAQSQTTSAQHSQSALKYLGKLGDQMFFELQHPNESGKNFTIYIQDASGVTLYRGRFDSKNFTKKFQVDGSQLDSEKLTFRILEDGSKNSQDFVVNNNVSVSENVVVTRL